MYYYSHVTINSFKQPYYYKVTTLSSFPSKVTLLTCLKMAQIKTKSTDRRKKQTVVKRISNTNKEPCVVEVLTKTSQWGNSRKCGSRPIDNIITGSHFPVAREFS